jgi:hypothetical protein
VRERWEVREEAREEAPTEEMKEGGRVRRWKR